MRYSPSSSLHRSPTYLKKTNLDLKEYHGVVWSILFIINLFFTFYICFDILHRTVGFKFLFDFFSSRLDNYNDNNNSWIICIKKSIKISFLSTIILNIFQLLYAFIFPNFYIKLHLALTLIYSFVPFYFYINYSTIDDTKYSEYAIYIVFFFFILGITFFYYSFHFIDTSTELMKTSIKILMKNPSLFLVDFIQSFILLIINMIYLLCFSVIKQYSSTVKINSAVIFYGIFTYYWIIMTIYYTCYMTTAGVVGYKFFLGNNKKVPKNSVLASFKRAITKNFGSACFAGLILVFIEIFKALVDFLQYFIENSPKEENNQDEISDKDTKKEVNVLIIYLRTLYYILKPILCLLEKCFDYVSRQSLIYCAVFGCSYKEGRKRYRKYNFYDRMNRLARESIVSGATVTNYVFLMIISGFVVYYVQSKTYEHEPEIVFTSVVFVELMMLAFSLMSSSISITTDTILLCYLENPNVLNQNYRTLYSKLNKINTYE